MITREEFDVIQRRLGKHGKPISRSHTFDLTGLFRCSLCGCAITASKKTKYYPKTNNTVSYVYYHCTKKNQNIKCTQPPIVAKEFEAAILEKLLLLRPAEEFVTWAKKWIKTIHEYESQTQEEVFSSQNRQLEGVENKLNNLLDMRINGDLDDTLYKTKKSELEQERLRVKSLVEKTGHGMSNWRLKVEKAVDIAYGSYLRFKTSGRDDRHEILLSIGSNLQLDHKKVRIDLSDHFEVFVEQENWEENYKGWLEPQKYTDIFDKIPDLRPANPSWLPD